MEKYSVLMSLYAKEKPEFLRQAIQSMVDQTLMPDEILIVKDGPVTDALQAVLDSFQEKYPELFTIAGYEENRGLGYALNFGLGYVRNELVARMDTDDISKPDRCETQLQYFREYPEVDIVGGDITEFIDEEANVVGRRAVPVADAEIREYMKKRCAMNHVSVMYKKTVIQAVGGYQDWFWNEDYYLWIRAWLKNAVFANTGTVLVNVRVGEEMYQRRGGKKYYDSEIGLQKYMLRHKMIGMPVYIENVLKRFIVQRLLPNSVRGWVFRTFAREKTET